MTNIIIQLPEDLGQEIAARLEEATRQAVAEMTIEIPAFEDYMTCEEASLAVGARWSEKTVRRYVREGRLPGVVDGQVVMVNRRALQTRWSEMENEKKSPIK